MKNMNTCPGIDRTRRAVSPLTVGVALTVLLAACSASSGPASTGAPLTIAAVAPFSGGDAGFGVHEAASCLSAVTIINASGGVLGHQLRCLTVDTKGDPADAVPVVEKTLATTSNILGILGPTSDEASAIAPILEAAKLPFICSTGQSIFDKTNLQFFYRMVPPDALGGAAMALWAYHEGLTRVAIVSGNDIGSEGSVPPIKSTLAKLGSPSLVATQILPLDASSYNTEVSRLINAHPQAILIELDPQSAATYFSELKQQLGSSPFPSIIGADPILIADWYKTVAAAIGGNLVQTKVVAEVNAGVTSGGTWQAFDTAMLDAAKSNPKIAPYTSNAGVEAGYDFVNLVALAAIQTKSTDTAVLNKEIVNLANGTSGAVDVFTFPQGERAIAAGKSIHYVGVTGPISFNQWHNSSAGLQMERFDTSGLDAAVPGSRQALGQLLAQYYSS